MKMNNEIYPEELLINIVNNKKPKEIYNKIPVWLREYISENKPIPV